MAVSGKNLKLGTTEARLPSGYLLRYIEIENFRGEVRDIQNIVVKFSITESLYSPTLVLQLSCKDSANFIEEFPILGMETIRLKLEYTEYNTGIPKDLDLQFFITEYPTYGRPEEQHVQVWTLKAISEQMFLSTQKKISRSFADNTANVIKEILINDLALASDAFELRGEPISKAKGIINWQSPMSAIEWLRKQTYDTEFAPFYLWQNLQGKYQLACHTDLVDIDKNPRYGTYFDSRGFNVDPLTPEDYEQRIKRIMNMASSLKLSKMSQSQDGAYASKHMLVNIANKSYRHTTYDYLEQFNHENTLEQEEVLSNQFGVQGVPLNLYSDTYNEFISTNSRAYGSTLSNLNENIKASRHILNAYNALMNTYTHDFKLHGDFTLGCGKRIEIKIPKAIDPSVYTEYTGKSDEELYDLWLSADYMITSIIHKFEDNEYFADLRVKRDSFTLDIDTYGR